MVVPGRNERFFSAYFSCIAIFKALYDCTSVRDRAYACFKDMWIPIVSVKHIWAPPFGDGQNGGLRLPLNNEPHSTKAVYPWGFPRKKSKLLWTRSFRSLLPSFSVTRRITLPLSCIQHDTHVQVSKKCAFLTTHLKGKFLHIFHTKLSSLTIFSIFLLISSLFFVFFVLSLYISPLHFFSSTSFLSLLLFCLLSLLSSLSFLLPSLFLSQLSKVTILFFFASFCLYSIPNFQEVLSHHLIYCFCFSSLFIVFFCLFAFFLFLISLLLVARFLSLLFLNISVSCLFIHVFTFLSTSLLTFSTCFS